MKTKRLEKGQANNMILDDISKDYKSIPEIINSTNIYDKTIYKAIERNLENNKIIEKEFVEDGKVIKKYKSAIINDFFSPDHLQMLIDKHKIALKNNDDLAKEPIEKEIYKISENNKIISNFFIDYIFNIIKKEPINNIILLQTLNNISHKLEKKITEENLTRKNKESQIFDKINNYMVFLDGIILDKKIDIEKRIELYKILSNVDIKRTFPLTLNLFTILNNNQRFKGYKRNIHKRYNTEFLMFKNDLIDRILKYYLKNPVDCKSKLYDLLLDSSIENSIRKEIQNICEMTIDPKSIASVKIKPEHMKHIEKQIRKKGISEHQFIQEIIERDIKESKKLKKNDI